MQSLPIVEDFMDKTFVTLKRDSDVYHAINILLEKGLTSAVVVDDYDHVIGILSEKDCLQLLTKGAYYVLPSGKVGDFMTEKVVTIGPKTDLFTTAEMFLKHFFRRLVIVDEDNKMIGQITRRDLLKIIKMWKKEEKKYRKAPIL